MAFDTLLVAAGSHPVHPRSRVSTVPGCTPAGRWKTPASIAACDQGRTRTATGAGFIGCIIMEALANRGVQLSRGGNGRPHGAAHDGPDCGRHDPRLVRIQRGGVFTSTKVESISRWRAAEGQVSQWPDGGGGPCHQRHRRCKPAIGFLKDSGITCLLGVLTDEHLQTNVPGIYAAGDCAEAFDKVSARPSSAQSSPMPPNRARGRAQHGGLYARAMALARKGV